MNETLRLMAIKAAANIQKKGILANWEVEGFEVSDFFHCFEVYPTRNDVVKYIPKKGELIELGTNLEATYYALCIGELEVHFFSVAVKAVFPDLIVGKLYYTHELDVPEYMLASLLKQ